MKTKTLIRITTVAIAAFTLPIWAADTTPTPPQTRENRPADRPAIRDHYQLYGRDGDMDRIQANRPEIPAELRELVQKFRDQREAFLKQQLELAKQLKDATEAQRDQIREQIKERLQEWREKQAEYRDRVRERVEEMKKELQEEMKKVVEAAKEENQRGRK